jgi:hypothetical protein
VSTSDLLDGSLPQRSTDGFDRDYSAFRACFARAPAEQPYGKCAVFEDLYGNRCDVVQFA